MSFIAELISIAIYPRAENLVVYGVLKQDQNNIKITYKCSADDVWKLLSHTGPFRFYIESDPTESKYKEMVVPMFQLSSFEAIAAKSEENKQKLTFNIKFDS